MKWMNDAVWVVWWWWCFGTNVLSCRIVWCLVGWARLAVLWDRA